MSAAAPDDPRAHRALGAWHDVARDRVKKVRRKLPNRHASVPMRRIAIED
jgi:hypothetical protein